MRRYKILAIICAVGLLTACGNTQLTQEEEYTKENYNVACLKTGFGILVGDLDNVNLVNEIEYLNSYDTAPGPSDFSKILHIRDWEFSKNDTVILYIDDGRVLQTSVDNVVLMYDPSLN